ncbi:unnamed protein product, partial [Brassica oleracea]
MLAALTHKIFVAVTLRKPFEKLGISPPFKKEVMTVSYRFEELLEKIIMKYEEKVEEQRQGSETMDALLAAYRDQKAEYKITKNHIEVLLAVTPLQKQYSGLWTMAEIINNRKILKRLREEIDSVRLYFQGNLNKGVKIGRFYIPKATSLVINVYAVMRDPDSWKDPDEFKPERFLGEEKERR